MTKLVHQKGMNSLFMQTPNKKSHKKRSGANKLHLRIYKQWVLLDTKLIQKAQSDTSSLGGQLAVFSLVPNQLSQF